MIRIGPAGWYPQPKPRGFHEATFLSGFFDTIEINSSFYRPASSRSVAQLGAASCAEPQFQVHRQTVPRVHARTKCDSAGRERVQGGLNPLAEAYRLGALLMQFPWSFKNTEESRAYLIALQARFREYPLVLEVRHGSWNQPGVLELLAETGVGLCNIDQPIFGRSIKPSALATSAVGYVRLHGRNYKQWLTENQQTGDRYNYLYSLDELQPWVDRVRSIATQAKDTYVVTNNHFLGKAVVNGLEIASLLSGKPAKVPPQLLEHYPRLREFS
jgi:uncharacterized protein YecE (DUF72 family)